MNQEEQLNIVGTIYDSVFRTECEHLKPLLIPVINELFRTDYAMEDVGVIRLANEHLLRDHDSDKENIKRITDGLIKLGDMMYHIECQSTSDGSILIRLVDYNLRIGYEDSPAGESLNRSKPRGSHDQRSWANMSMHPMMRRRVV